jgi:regulator of protease activity HflC (stomatin/prohibitin superfamily)
VGYFIALAFVLFVFVVISFISKLNDFTKHRLAIGIFAWAVLLIGVATVTFHRSTYQIPTGHIGVIYEFGAIKGQCEEGLQFVAPWRMVRVENIQVQQHAFAGRAAGLPKLSCFSKESQMVEVDATLNIRVSKDAIQQLFRTVGPNFFEVLVAPRVYQNFKDEIVKYASVEVAPNREPIRKAVSHRLETELKPYSIEVVDLLLNNVDFSQAFEAAIEQKQIATQKALEEEQRIKVETNKAMQAVERAKGEGNAILAKALQEAEANKKLSESLTPAFLQYALIRQLGDKIQVIMLPTSGNFILDPNAILKGAERK